MVDDHDAVADELDLGEQVRVEHHRDPAPLHLDEQVTDRAAPRRVQGARRLVEQEELRLPDERLRDPEPLLHALAHLLHAAAAGVGEADEAEEVLALAGALLRAGELLVQDEDLVGRGPAGEAEELGQVALGGAGGPRSGRVAGDVHRPGARPDEAAGDLRERALARPVGPEQADELAPADLQIDPVERDVGAVALAEPLDAQRCAHRREPFSRRNGFSTR